MHFPTASLPLEPGSLLFEMCRLAPGCVVRALVVDDVLENRKVLSTLLQMAGCDVVTADNAREAIQAAADLTPDIVFMDLRLPDLDGFEGTRHILRAAGARRIRVVGTSASVLDRERERCLAAGCDEFLAKPFLATQIYGCIAELLDVTFVRRSALTAAALDAGTDLTRIVLPEQLVVRMNEAAEFHSATALKGCLDELEGGEAECRHFAEHLRGHLASYDMDTIQQILAQVRVESAVPAHDV